MKKEKFLKTALVIFAFLSAYYFFIQYPREKAEKALDTKILKLDNAIQLDGKTLDVAAFEAFEKIFQTTDIKKLTEIAVIYSEISMVKSKAKRDKHWQIYYQETDYKRFEKIAKKDERMKKVLKARKAISDNNIRIIEKNAEKVLFSKLEVLNNTLK